MDDLYFYLEAQIKALIQQCDQLKQANTLLKQSKFALTREKEVLLAKHQTAIQQIESMVSRLRTVEKTT